MSTVSVVDVDCPLCGSTQRKRVFNVADYSRPDHEERFGVCRCMACGCGYLSPRFLAADLHRYYDTSFYWGWEGGTALEAEALLQSRKQQIAAKKDLIKDLAPGRLLDVGAMKGEFVYSMHKDGWDAEGIEFSQVAPNIFGIPMRYGDFVQLSYEAASYDCITMWAVLEHIYEPMRYLQKVQEILKPGGRLVVLVTNFTSVQGRLLKLDDFPRHLTLFTKGSLARALRESGLTPQEMFTSQEVFASPMYGSLVEIAKRVAGYTADEVQYERRAPDPLAFCCKWRGVPSAMTKLLNRVDRVVSLPLERLLDIAGFGHTLATKP
jgi:SAM-dependent methyltransferase